MPGLNHFYDVEDTGDEYTYCPLPEHSQTISTVGAQATITRTEDGPCRATFRIERTLNIPAGLTEDRQRRSAETVTLPMVSYVGCTRISRGCTSPPRSKTGRAITN